MLVREGNKIRVENKERKDELFKGLIGKVNATKKDADTLASYLRKHYSEKQMDITTGKEGFMIFGFFVFKNSRYNFVIGEKSKDKICIELNKRDHYLDDVKGLTLNNSKIFNALYTMMESNGIDTNKIEATSRVDKREYEKERQRKHAWTEAEKEREQKELEKIRKEKEAELNKKGKMSLSRQDWMDILPVSNAWIIDPGRL